MIKKCEIVYTDGTHRLQSIHEHRQEKLGKRYTLREHNVLKGIPRQAAHPSTPKCTPNPCFSVIGKNGKKTKFSL